ncbi:MAG: hypothetical protein AAF633_04305 [Chloroflexota bacterium]
MTATLFVRHRVNHMAHWLNGYKSRSEAGLLKEYGIIAESVHTDLNGGDTVIVMHQFADETALNAFKSLFESELFRAEAAKEGGVLIDTMEMWAGADA